LADGDTTVIDKVATDLSSLLGLRADPTMTRIDRHPQGLPLYFGAYSQRLEAIHQQLRGAPGLHLCGAYSGGVSVRDRLAQGAALAERIADEAHSGAARYRPVRGGNGNQKDKPFAAQVSGSGLS
jgi:protoporphyrinogen oxidase